MNILLVNYEYPPLGGGAGNATMFIGRSLVEMGHHPVVLTSAFADLPQLSDDTGVTVHRVHARRRSADRSDQIQMASFTLAALRACRRIAKMHRIDSLIAFFTIPSAPVGWWLWRIMRIPYVISLRGGDVPGHVPRLRRIHQLLTPMRRAILRDAIGIVANSDSLAALARRTDAFPVHTIPNGVDGNFFHPAAQRRRNATQAFRIIFVGRVHVEKNIDVLLRAMAALPDGQRDLVRLDVVGDGPARPALEHLSAELAVAGQITWLGWRSKDEVAELYRSADCLVNPSSYEGMPNTVLEAMASALPVIASDVGGNNEVITSGKTGLLFDVSSCDGLREHLSTLMAHPDLALALGAAARDRALAQFSWDRVAEQYVALFQTSARTSATTAAASSF